MNATSPVYLKRDRQHLRVEALASQPTLTISAILYGAHGILTSVPNCVKFDICRFHTVLLLARGLSVAISLVCRSTFLSSLLTPRVLFPTAHFLFSHAWMTLPVVRANL